MPRNLVSARVALTACLLLLAPGAFAGPGPCPPNRPDISGPSEVHRLEGYWITWTNVLSPRGSGQPDTFLIERSEDPTFQSGVERLQCAEALLQRLQANLGHQPNLPRHSLRIRS